MSNRPAPIAAMVADLAEVDRRWADLPGATKSRLTRHPDHGRGHHHAHAL